MNRASLYALVIDRFAGHAHLADVRTSVVHGHLRNDRVSPSGAAGRADAI